MTAGEPARHSGDRPPQALPRAFFARPAPEVAAELCGKLLVRVEDGLSARVVETEAYTADDPACHAHRGRTARNAPLFGPPGHAYVYRSYGMHWLLNVVTGAEGAGEGVLLRAAEPLDGIAVLRERRGGVGDRDLLRGPGRLGQGFGLDGTWSGRDLCGWPPPPLHLADDGHRPVVSRGPRVGVSAAADVERRYLVQGSRWVSPYTRSPRAQRRGSG